MKDLMELAGWLCAFKSDRSRAFYTCPDLAYTELRTEGYLDIQNDLTEKGEAVLKLGIHTEISEALS